MQFENDLGKRGQGIKSHVIELMSTLIEERKKETESETTSESKTKEDISNSNYDAENDNRNNSNNLNTNINTEMTSMNVCSGGYSCAAFITKGYFVLFNSLFLCYYN